MLELKTSATPAGTSAPLTYLKGTVLSVDLDNQVAEVQFPDRRDKISLTSRRGKGGIPAEGETWIFDQIYGVWMFAVLLSDPRPASWIAADLLAGWSALSGSTSPAYQKDGAGAMRFQGVVSGSGFAVSAATGPLACDILRLPEGCRPATAYGPVPASSNHAYGELLVLPSGYVRAQVGTGWISLAGLSYMAEK